MRYNSLFIVWKNSLLLNNCFKDIFKIIPPFVSLITVIAWTKVRAKHQYKMWSIKAESSFFFFALLSIVCKSNLLPAFQSLKQLLTIDFITVLRCWLVPWFMITRRYSLPEYCSLLFLCYIYCILLLEFYYMSSSAPSCHVLVYFFPICDTLTNTFLLSQSFRPSFLVFVFGCLAFNYVWSTL